MRPTPLLAAVALAAGCLGPSGPTPTIDEPATAAWDGRLFAYRALDMFLAGQGTTTEVVLIPTPGAPATLPATCDIIAADSAAQNATCGPTAQGEPWAWLDPGRITVDSGCDSVAAPPSSDIPETQGYVAPWAVKIAWENGSSPTAGTARAVLANWSVALRHANGTTMAYWHGTVSPCFSIVHGDRLVPFQLGLVRWGWHSANKTMVDSSTGRNWASFTADAVYKCFAVKLSGLVDEYGFRARVENENQTVHTHEERADFTRAGAPPRELPTTRFNLTNPGGWFSIQMGYPGATPPTAEQARTRVDVEVVALRTCN